MNIDKIIAIHEAAHAAICLVEKIPFKEVSIIPTENSEGRVSVSSEFISNHISNPLMTEVKKFIYLRKYLTAVLAGLVAERKINSESSYAEKDNTDALMLALRYFGDDMNTSLAFCNFIIAEIHSKFSYVIDEENNEIEDTPLWNFVLELSERLMLQKRVSHHACKKHFKEVCP